MTSSCSANFDPIWTKLGWIGAVIMPVTWTQSRRSLDWSVAVVFDESGCVVVLDDGGRPAVVNPNLVMLFTPLPSRRQGSANGAHNLSFLDP